MYKSNKFHGLTEKEVKESREKYGENSLTKKKRKGFIRSFLESFGDPIIKVLLTALAINTIFLFNSADWFESVGIAVAILLATLISTISEYGNEAAFEKLQEEASRINSRVQRKNGLVQIPMSEIVVGDLVLLQSGDKVPADGIIVQGQVDVDQSSLNGESKEAKKHFKELPQNYKKDFLEPALLFSGTIICAGECIMRVTEVGDKTFYGNLAQEIQEETRETPLKLRLGNLAKSISKFGYIAAIVTVISYLYNSIVLANNFDMQLILHSITTPNLIFSHLLKAATLAVTVIVMAVPEGLPMMITVVLSANMRRMLKDNVFVRKLVGIETAGSLNILFTDKTGTLTQGKLDVTHFVSGSGTIWNKNENQLKNTNLWKVLQTAVYYNNSATMNNNVAIGGNATDRSTLEFVSTSAEFEENITKVDIIPFSSETKFMATTVSGDWNATFIKGAPEKILPFCTQYYDENGNVHPILSKSKIESILKDFAQKAIRIIAVAIADGSRRSAVGFKNLKFVGLLGIRDEIRKEVTKGVQEVQAAGIQTVMITGDSKLTAHAIAREIGLVNKNTDLVMTSEELNNLSDAEISNMLPNLRVIARALPSDKSRLVRIAQDKGLVVGMTGDGVNDAPALKKADVGFAMGSGTEIAKESSDIVILDNDFNSICKAICYGRTIFKSIRKFIIYQLSTCICAVSTTIIGSFIGVEAPITVIQMLWINIVMDTLAGLAFSGEKARQKYMQEPPKPRNESIINKYMRGQIAINSIYTTILCLVFLKSSFIQNIFMSNGSAYMMTGFFTLFMFSAIFRGFCVRTHQINLFEYISANKPFLWVMAIIGIIQIFIIYFGGTIFRTVGLDLKDTLLVGLIAFTIVPIDIIRKYYLMRKGELIGT